MSLVSTNAMKSYRSAGYGCGAGRVDACADTDTIMAINVGTKNTPIDSAPSETSTHSNTTITTRDRYLAVVLRSVSGNTTSKTGIATTINTLGALARQQGHPRRPVHTSRLRARTRSKRERHSAESSEHSNRRSGEVPPSRHLVGTPIRTVMNLI